MVATAQIVCPVYPTSGFLSADNCLRIIASEENRFPGPIETVYARACAAFARHLLNGN